MSEPDYRAQFDATVTFSNGGGLTARDFRVDVPHAAVSAAEVGALLVASLALLMVDRVEVRALRLFPEQHKGTRGGPSDRTGPPPPRRGWVARLVGIDAVNIDDTGDPARPAHSVLLAAGIPVVEHLTGLDQLPPTGARFTAAPPRIAGFSTFPVRAYAALPGS